MELLYTLRTYLSAARRDNKDYDASDAALLFKLIFAAPSSLFVCAVIAFLLRKYKIETQIVIIRQKTKTFVW